MTWILLLNFRCIVAIGIDASCWDVLLHGTLVVFAFLGCTTVGSEMSSAPLFFTFLLMICCCFSSCLVIAFFPFHCSFSALKFPYCGFLTLVGGGLTNPICPYCSLGIGFADFISLSLVKPSCNSNITIRKFISLKYYY